MPMMILVQIVLLLVVAFSPTSGPCAEGDSPIELTLESSIKMAIDSATTVLTNKNDVELAAAQVLRAYGQFLPTLSASVGVGANQGKSYNYAITPTVISDRTWGANIQISAGVNIFNGFADSAGLESALEKKAASQLTLDWARQQISLDVAQAFLQAAYDQRLLVISQENLKVSQARQELLEAQVKVGLKDMTDLLRQKALTSRDDSTVSKVSAARKADLLELLRRLRLDARKEYRIVEPKMSKPTAGEAAPLENELIKVALQKRADLKASERALVASKRDIDVADSGYLPKLDFGLAVSDMGRMLTKHTVGNVDYLPASQRSLGQQLGDQIMYSLGLTLTWNIFDRDLTKVNLERAKVASKSRQIESEDVRNAVVIAVRRAHAEYVGAKNQLTANEAGRVAAEKAFEAIKTKYEVGTTKFVDVADAQAALVEAESAEAESIFQVELRRRALLTVTGQQGN